MSGRELLKRSHRNCQAPWQNSQAVQELVERQSVPLALECSYSGALPCAPALLEQGGWQPDKAPPLLKSPLIQVSALCQRQAPEPASTPNRCCARCWGGGRVWGLIPRGVTHHTRWRLCWDHTPAPF